MSSLKRLLAVSAAICLAAGCGTTSSGTGSGSGGPPDAGVGSPPDAGGSGGGTPDAGPGGVPDAGTGGGGAGGSDGGTAASDCDGLSPGVLPAMITYQQQYSTASELCMGQPIGDGNGFVAVHVARDDHPAWNILTPAGTVNGSFGFWHGDAWPNPDGFIGYGGSSTQQVVNVEGFDESGHGLTDTPVNGSATFAPDPNGGLFAVGFFNDATGPTPPPPHQMYMKFRADGHVQYGPMELRDDAAVFGAGVDELGHTLVLLDGGSGNIDALWLDERGGSPRSGTPTAPFRLITGFQAGPSTWFETSPLIGGGLAVRRMDATRTPGDERRTSRWLGIVQHDSHTLDDPPDWLASRPDTNMQIVRGGRGYAFTPWAADVPACDQQVEVVSASGNACGKADFPVDGNACTTRELRVGLDGTVMQMLPADREGYAPGSTVVRSCTLRFWPALLR